MIEHVWSILCNNSSIDYETSVVSINNVLEQINLFSDKQEVSKLIPIPHEIISLWVLQNPKEPSCGKMRAILIDPKNNSHIHGEMDINLSDTISFRTRIKGFGLSIKYPGKYSFNIELKQEDSTEWEKVASLPLFVSFHPG